MYINNGTTSRSNSQPTAPAADPVDSSATIANTDTNADNADGNAISVQITPTADASGTSPNNPTASPIDNDNSTELVNEDLSGQDAIDVLELGKQPLDEISFRYWINRLRNNPQLLEIAVNEYLENTDSTRARNLAALLGEVNTPMVLDAATRLTQSTNTASQLNGLELLARLQPENTHARNHAIDLLATQSDPDLLVATLNVFATPAQAVSAEQRQLLVDHAQLLTTHSDANVRALGIDTISKWSRNDSGLAATIGLQDSNSAVRAKSAASLIGAKSPSAASMQGLLAVAADKQEIKTTRQLALYALSKMPLSASDRQRYEALEVEVRRTRQ